MQDVMIIAVFFIFLPSELIPVITNPFQDPTGEFIVFWQPKMTITEKIEINIFFI